MKGQLKVSKETVTEIERFCTENGISRKVRLQELGISEGSYYYTKSLLREEYHTGGSFIQLSSGAGDRHQQQSRSRREKTSSEAMTIEIRTPSGTEMRITGCFAPEMLKTIISNV